MDAEITSIDSIDTIDAILDRIAVISGEMEKEIEEIKIIFEKIKAEQ